MSDAEPIAWSLSGFGDEIDPNPEVQVAVLHALGARFIEVRSAWGVNVVDLDDAQLAAQKAVFAQSGMGVSAIASPIGKVGLDGDPRAEVDRLRRVIRVAEALGTSSIRIFSFFLEGTAPEQARSAVMERMSLLADAAEQAGVTLLHENEKGIYGDTPERVLDLVETVGSPAVRVAWDSANFVQVGVAHPHDEGYAKLRPYLDYLQVKDALSATGEVVPAGEGDGQVAATVQALAADGYRGFASLEPHLASAHDLGGFSGAFAFGVAARAFRRLADDAGIALR
ncbi:sugar phosphate isomerase/epimerase [Microbacterium sp. SS28]|uniref:sugar phosphate isomerase/epimerase family protein n=1 Tax=Microbacterium sp. SS28 TaxID=2919948 RepID=UPI001FA96671|nr:sugar phosphate isomerase/epimerase family protein [Microbacterium sp. SS28]